MKQKLFSKYKLFYIFFIIYFIAGILLSLNVGITHDEPHSNWVWELNKKKISNFFLDTKYDVSELDTYHGFYGIGPYLLSAPLELIFSNFFSHNNISADGSILLIKHPTVFIFYFISAIFFKKIIFMISRDKNFSYLSTIFYLCYPYIFGHSFFNIKDIPFMSIWTICTFYIIKIMNNYFYNDKFKIKDIIIFALITSYLMSIRINGILIFYQYLIFLLLYLKVFKKNFISFTKKNVKEIFLFIIIFFGSTYILYPNFWNDPTKFVNAIMFFGQISQTVCTVTLGECMKTQNLPPSYIFIWLLFKLPILILIGLILFPFVEKKLFQNRNNVLILGSLIITVSTIILLFALFRVNLYDEVRQILFLVPLIFIISLVLLYNFKKKLSFYLIGLFSLFFIFQNIKVFPYNYLWLNNLNILVNVKNNFELDYWGLSTKKIANFLNNKATNTEVCIISNRNDGIKYFISNQKRCFKPFNELHKKNIRPFYVALTERALKKGLPNNCKVVNEEKIKINFSKEQIVLARVYKCV